ncbi:MAG: twin-arginine translocase TatA/TatE family subunit [Desulfobacteraceae bacterium]|nr:MAG: twin-arginine translocase TatA/TatE family subunit [Desulfobacteraceae bacterium]
MGSLGMQEIVIIFIIALIIFGPRKLPELGKTIGKGLSEFKKASNELKQTWEDEVSLDKEKASMNEIIKDVKEEASLLTTEIPEIKIADSVGSKDIQ